MAKRFLSAAGILMLAGLLPAEAWASEPTNANRRETVQSAIAISSDQEQQDDKKSKRKKRDNEDKKNDNIKQDGKKPDIKEVPRSIPKLKPKAVTDKVKIKRPPIKVKPKGLLRVL